MGAVPGSVRAATAVQVVREPLYASSGEPFGYWIRAVHRDLAGSGDRCDLDCSDAVAELVKLTTAGALSAGGPALFDVHRPMLDGRVPLPRVIPGELLNLPLGVIGDPKLAPILKAQAIRGRRFCVPAADLLLGGSVPGGPGSMVVFDLSEQSWRSVVSALGVLPRGRHVVAGVHIDDQATFQRCVELGFSIVHGRWPKQAQRAAAAAEGMAVQAVALQVVARLADPEVALDQVVNLLSSDDYLTIRLLKWASSAATGWGRRVESVREAITVIGLARLRAWMVMATIGTLPQARHTVLDALTAARMAELLARRLGESEPESAFTAALLQSLSAAWGPEAVVDPLRGTAGAPERILRMLHGDGCGTGIPAALSDVRWYEGGAASSGSLPAGGTRTAVPVLRSLYGEAVSWAHLVANAND